MLIFRVMRRYEQVKFDIWKLRFNRNLPVSISRQFRSSESNNSEGETKSKIPNLSPRNILVAFGVSLCAGISLLVYNTRKASTRNQGHSTDHRFVMPNTRKLVLFKRKGHWIPHDFIGNDKQMEEIKAFRVREDDIFVASFPKSGTTWVQEIVFQITHVESPDASLKMIDDRFPYLEFAYPGIKELDKITKQRRFIKTHVQLDALPQDILDGKGKVIYVARNAKDVAVSMFHFYKIISSVNYSGPFTEFCEIFNSGKVAYGPYWKHVSEYWCKRELENFLFISYEDLQKDGVTEIKKIAKFVGTTIDEKQAKEIAAKSSFKYMKRNPYTNYNLYKLYGLLNKKGSFMRKGEVGDWKNYFSDELCEQTDALTKAHFEPLGLHLTDDISR